jgi:hypothetical protein
MRRSLLLTFFLVAVACAQTAPPRTLLPPVGDLVPEPQVCGFLVGEGTGVEIEDVVSGSPSEGILEEGDVLTALDGLAITNAGELREALAARSVGDRVSLTVLRDGVEARLEVVLGAGPDDPARPVLGVLINTAFDRVPAAEVAEGSIEGRLVRPVSIGEEMYLVDPVAARWASLGVAAPNEIWAAVGKAVVVLENAAPTSAILLDRNSGRSVRLDGDGWEGTRIMGTLGSDVVVSAQRAVPEEPDLSESGVLLVDFTRGQVRWDWLANFSGVIPVASYPSPDGSMLLVIGSDTTDQKVKYLVLDSEGTVQIDAGELPAADEQIALGWFDDQSVLLRAVTGEISLLDISTGATTEASFPPGLVTVPRAWAVGDGVNVIADTGSRLVRFDLAGQSEIRVLADSCLIGAIGDIGWGA